MQERPSLGKLPRLREKESLGNVKSELGFKVAHREVIEVGSAYALSGRKAKLTSPILAVKMSR